MPFRSKPKSFLDDSRRDWQFDTFAWLLRNCGGYAKFSETVLVLPTEEHFPDRGMKGHAAVAALFRRTRDHAGMADWPCTVELETDPPREAPTEAPGIRVFTYRRGGLEPIALVARFACGLAGYLAETFEEVPPGGAAAQVPAIEVAAVFMGFGVFLANTAVRSSCDLPGGGLNEGELANALGIFCLLRGMSTDEVDTHLNPHFRKYLRLATRDLAQHEIAFRRLRATVALDAQDAKTSARAR